MRWITDGERWRAWLVDHGVSRSEGTAWRSPDTQRPHGMRNRRKIDERIALTGGATPIVSVRYPSGY